MLSVITAKCSCSVKGIGQDKEQSITNAHSVGTLVCSADNALLAFFAQELLKRDGVQRSHRIQIQTSVTFSGSPNPPNQLITTDVVTSISISIGMLINLLCIFMTHHQPWKYLTTWLERYFIYTILTAYAVMSLIRRCYNMHTQIHMLIDIHTYYTYIRILMYINVCIHVITSP